MGNDFITVRGARQHNLKNINVDIPRHKLVVITGLSGSGKSSLAFDTIYAEGQRRYVESLSSYARQFLGLMDKPDVDYIGGLSPAISIDQKTTGHNPRSTVGTVTEIYDYLRLLYARVGKPYCPNCHTPIEPQTVEQIVDQVVAWPEGTRFIVLAPVIRDQKGEHIKVFEDLRKGGYQRVRVDGTVHNLDEVPELAKMKKHRIEAVIDRLIVRPDLHGRLADSLETALNLAGGVVILQRLGGEGEEPVEQVFSLNLACPECGFSFAELSPRLFSFNAPVGACPTCGGLGSDMVIDPALVIPDPERSLNQGAIAPWASSSSQYYANLMEQFDEAFGINIDTPWEQLPAEHQDIILHGSQAKKLRMYWEHADGTGRYYESYFKGVIPMLERSYRETTSETYREDLANYMSERPCKDCHGKRLRPEALSVLVGGKNIAEVTDMTVKDALTFFEGLTLGPRDAVVGAQVLKEIRARLGFLVNVGLDYLSMSRKAGTLSGGESQRIRLATQIGSGLTGVLYILDEPSIGLHQRDNDRLIATLQGLRDLGNTVIVVEHDEETMRSSDYIIDIGPGAGEHGGHVVAAGTIDEISQNENSITGQYLSGKRSVPIPRERRAPNGKWLSISGARQHNLKDINVRIPLNVFIAITGVSGSGKSSLINDILYRDLAMKLNHASMRPGEYDSISGREFLDKVIDIDQSPIGRTPRSNPATYTGTFDLIRQLYAETQDAKMRGYTPGRFSFNVRGGRCEACKGDGIIKIEMNFLPDVYVPCEVCKGRRYNRETLEVHYKGKSISDVLDMTVDEALGFFENQPRIRHKLETLNEVGLGYIRLGQPATTLSGGEAQRVKLATELSRRSNGRTMYILDEPTTGLHVADVEKLLHILQRLVEAGDTVLVIEHNLDVIKTADYIIDLGPEGGDQGGQLIASGTPEQIAEVPESYTGQFLARLLPVNHL
jgi:excinuclease ABC subunit A